MSASLDSTAESFSVVTSRERATAWFLNGSHHVCYPLWIGPTAWEPSHSGTTPRYSWKFSFRWSGKRTGPRVWHARADDLSPPPSPKILDNSRHFPSYCILSRCDGMSVGRCKPHVFSIPFGNWKLDTECSDGTMKFLFIQVPHAVLFIRSFACSHLHLRGLASTLSSILLDGFFRMLNPVTKSKGTWVPSWVCFEWIFYFPIVFHCVSILYVH